MGKEIKRFRLEKFRFETDTGGFIDRYMITDRRLPMLEINQWVEAKNLRKSSTGKEYAGKLTVFLNYLDSVDLEYDEAGNRHVQRFIDTLIYGDYEDLKIKSIETMVSYSTLKKYVTVITQFYKWLDYNYETNMIFHSKQGKIKARKSFLYGQIYTYDYQYIIDSCLPRLKGRKEYKKWYQKEEKVQLTGGFLSLRDQAVFCMTLEGFRIDEVLSMTLDSYQAFERQIQPTRSKGKADVRQGNDNHLRTVSLPGLTCEILDRYIETERMEAENESGILSQNIFININRGKYQGRPLSYRNYLKIMKRCAARVGIDEAKIRTHNGRSTKAMEYLECQALHPEAGITDVMIAECFGWSSLDSIKHYRNHNNQIIAKSASDKLLGREGRNGGTNQQ